MALSRLAVGDDGLVLRAYPGAGSVLLAFDVPDALQEDLAGFAVEVTAPGEDAQWLVNRLTFTDPITAATTPAERQQITTTTDKAPLQKFHWAHYPPRVVAGEYTYRATAMLFEPGSETEIVPGPQASVSVDLSDDGFADFTLGFTRGYVSSQAYASRFHNAPLLPSPQTIGFDTAPFAEQYDWLGFGARKLVFDLLEEVRSDSDATLDVFAYDFNEPDIVRALAALGPRLRLFQDDSKSHVAEGDRKPLEVDALALLRASAGEDHVKVGHFQRFQHNKVMILRRGGAAVKVLSGSANFSIRGLYVQSNNVFVFDDAQIAGLYAQAFDQAWSDPSTSAFQANPISQQWFDATSQRLPKLAVSFSPHRDPSVSLGPIADAVKNAKSSVLFAIMEIGAGSGPVLDEVRKLPARIELYAFGTTQRLDGALSVTKPGEQSPFIPFSYLKEKVPPPFQAEYSGGAGQVVHHKFVVVDFNGDAPVVFAGSSNLAAGGENQNGDNLVAIHDARIATAYAVEAIGLIDHYRFRVLQQASGDDNPLRLKHRSEHWAAGYFDPTNPKYRERRIFADDQEHPTAQA
jgi:phosphatidylserine/phosphatidylglycerophosphate/cardiolipin synthase-like enzyme